MYEYNCTVTKVTDGDTVDVSIDLGFGITKMERVRLYGINAPELHSGKGMPAKLRLQELAPRVDRIKTVKDRREKYGRLLAVLYLGDDGSVNDMLVSEGLVETYYG